MAAPSAEGLPGSQATLTTWATPGLSHSPVPLLTLASTLPSPSFSFTQGYTIGSPKECAPEALTLVPMWTKGQ